MKWMPPDYPIYYIGIVDGNYIKRVSWTWLRLDARKPTHYDDDEVLDFDPEVFG